MPNDVASMLGVPELAAPSAQPAPPAQTAPQGDPAVWTVLGEAHPGDLSGEFAVASTFANRQRAGGYGSYADVVNDPANGYQAWQTPATRAKIEQTYPVGSPQYQAVSTMLDGLRSGQSQPLPYTHYHMTGMKNPPAWGAGPGTDIGGNTFYTLPSSQLPQAQTAPTGSVADALGLTPQERAALQTGAQPTTPAAAIPGSKAEFNFGPQMGAMSQAAVQTFHGLANDPNRGIDPNASPGSPKLPFYVTPGTVVPQTPGIHWVDANGQEHVNPGGTLERVGSAMQGAFQGIPVDLGSSLTKMTGGVFGIGTPQQALQADAAQQRAYAIQHLGDPYAQAGRFAGQAALGTAAALATPELEAPAALGAFGRLAAGGATNALRGVAATAPSVGANPQPVAQQLATGALVGAVAPALTGGAANAAGAVTGLGRTVSPEVAALADTAQSKYGIPLRSGQVMGANGDRAAATADSNLLGSDAKVLANNQAQKQAFMRGMTNTYGDASGDVSADALSAARAKVVAPLNEAATRTSISPVASDAVQIRIGQIIGDAQKVLPDNEVKPLLNMAQAIGDVRGPTGISGESYQALTREGTPLDRLEQSADPNVRYYASQIHDALNDGLAASSAPEDVAAVAKARWQYKNLMTVAQLAPKADVNGFISPALLRGAVGTKFKNQAFQGAGDLGELAQIGQTFMKEPPNSFTYNRAADILGPIRLGAEAGGLTAIGGMLLQRPETGIAAAGSALAGYGAKVAAQAIKRNKVAGSAAGIVQRSLPNAPRSALAGVGTAAQAVEVPLSALAGVRATQLQPVTP